MPTRISNGMQPNDDHETETGRAFGHHSDSDSGEEGEQHATQHDAQHEWGDWRDVSERPTQPIALDETRLPWTEFERYGVVERADGTFSARRYTQPPHGDHPALGLDQGLDHLGAVLDEALDIADFPTVRMALRAFGATWLRTWAENHRIDAAVLRRKAEEIHVEIVARRNAAERLSQRLGALVERSQLGDTRDYGRDAPEIAALQHQLLDVRRAIAQLTRDEMRLVGEAAQHEEAIRQLERQLTDHQ